MDTEDYGPAEMPLALVVKLRNGDVLHFPHYSENERVLVGQLQQKLMASRPRANITSAWVELNGKEIVVAQLPEYRRPQEFW